MYKNTICVLVIYVTSFTALAQQTQYYADAEAAYKNGLELFAEKNYLSARQKFEEIYHAHSTATGHTNLVMLQNLEYYVAVCAAETGDKDAEQLMLAYYQKHHETDKRRLLNFYLGRYYYTAKRYGDAIEYFSKLKLDDLDNTQIYQYKFMLAYSYFTKKKFAEAKPLFSSIKDIQDKYFYPATYYYAFICFYNKEYDDALESFTKIEDSKMYASVIPYYIAQIYYLKKNYPKTISYIKKTLEKQHVLYKEELSFLLGKSYFQANEYDKAYPLLDTYVSKSKKVNKEDIYQLAYCAYMTGNYQKAVENFLQLTVLDDQLGQSATYSLADCYLKQGQKDKARSAFQSAASKNFDKTMQEQSLFNYGKLSFELGYYNDAIRSFELYANDYPTGNHVGESNELLAAALAQTKDYERAYKIIEGISNKSILIKGVYQKVAYFRAVELFNDHQSEAALALVNKSLNSVVDIEIQALALYLKAELLYAGGQYSEAARLYQKFSEYASPALEKKGEASKFRAAYNVAYCSFKQKNYSDAAVYFGNAIAESKTTPDSKGKTALLPDLYLRFADCSFISKNYNKAVEAYEKIVAMNWPNAEYAQFQKGIILGLQNKEEEKAAAMKYLIAKFPGSNYADQANFELGETYLQMGDYTNARQAYQAIIAKNTPTAYLPKAYLKIGVIDNNTGKKEQAIEDYKLVVKKFSDLREAKEALEALKDIYVEVGRADEFFAFAKANSNLVITSTEEDSLTYQAAEHAYINNEWERAAILYASYTQKFPSGIFVNEAYWKQADGNTKAKDFATALSAYEGIIKNNYSKYFEKALLKASGIAYYELKDTVKANTFYKQLLAASTSAQNTYTAMLGLLRTSLAMQNNDAIIEYADQLINTGTAKEADLQEAYYEKARAYYRKGNLDFALAAFNHVTEMPVSEKAVEAKYMAAKILFEQQDYKNSLDTCFKLKNKYGSYEYWVVKTFILMADNYLAQANLFQAKATLESIVNNYDGDPQLLQEAKSKLEHIRSLELDKSKIIELVPSDTLLMEPEAPKN